ncbi:MAG: hypothetical protein QXN55_00805 [Candidatus Nitrosotenuis sp.]
MKSTEWYVAKIKPAGLTLFNDAFYPVPDPDTNELYVYIKPTLVINPDACRVSVINGKTGARVISGSTAATCLEIIREATEDDIEIINKNLSKLTVRLS